MRQSLLRTQMSCISRRANADRTSFKLFKEKNGSIKERNYIWTEYRCPNAVLDGTTLCNQCCHKDPSVRKYQALAKFNHGNVGGPYTPQSKLYGSPYYLGLIKNGWKIKEEDERRAKEAQQKANMPRKPKVDEAGSGLGLTINTVIPTDILVSPSTVSPTVSNPSPKKPRKIKVSKPVATPLPITGPAEFLESIEPPIQVCESQVIVVRVKKIRCQGTDYYYDSKSGKLYAVSAKGVGPYKGRYNPTDETIHPEYPDSDDE